MTEKTKNAEEVKTLDKEQLKRWMEEKDDLVVLDVLSGKSFRQMHIKNAVNIPLKELDEQTAKEKLDKSQTIVVYCANYDCPASEKAVSKLKEAGFEDVYDYPGGLKEWQSDGLPVEGEFADKGVV